MNLIQCRSQYVRFRKCSKLSTGELPGWLMTAVASWGENAEDAYDQGLVEMGLGDSGIEVQGAFLPMGFETPLPSHYLWVHWLNVI